MNKQALAFLTMFSLVLMLSVYYVTLPSDSTSVVTKDSTKDTQQSETNSTNNTSNGTTTAGKDEDTSSDPASTLQEEIDQKINSELNTNNEVIANKDSKEDEKKQALTTMETLKADKELQTSIRDALTKSEINSAVEIKNGTCTITVFDQKSDKTLATSVMKTANSIINNKYLIEVTFK